MAQIIGHSSGGEKKSFSGRNYSPSEPPSGFTRSAALPSQQKRRKKEVNNNRKMQYVVRRTFQNVTRGLLVALAALVVCEMASAQN
jgi:hypothetical protein